MWYQQANLVPSEPHSFAVMALNYGMPIESVSKILGHTDIKTTQIYAKVTCTKLDHDISQFESRIDGHFTTQEYGKRNNNNQ